MRTLADLALELNFRRKPRLPRLILVSDDRRLPDPTSLAERLPPGSIVLLRSYDCPDRRELADRLARLCRRRRLHLLVAGDWRLALDFRAGLHMPEGLWRLPPAVRLWHRRSGRLLTLAAHSGGALVRAAAQGADAALLSPVFATASHPGKPGLGALRFRRLVRASPLPVYALGGISTRTAAALRGCGAAGLATVGGLQGR